MPRFVSGVLCLAALAIIASGQQAQPARDEAVPSSYILGPGDELVIRALGIEEISEKPVRVDMNGYVRLPLAGRVGAAGLTVEQFVRELNDQLKTYIVEPDVAVEVTAFRSQPVSVFGAVKQPGVLQLEGRRTLIEVLSQAGGLDQDAGHSVKITRRIENGRIPLPAAADDPTGQFSIAEVELNSVMQARNPQENVLIKPFDVISVPRAELVFVIGQVKKAGGFVLRERETMSVLQALALAEGLDRVSAPQAAKILRQTPGTLPRMEISVNLRKILQGQADDVPLQPQDILFIPISATKNAGLRVIEAAIQVGTGLAIYRR